MKHIMEFDKHEDAELLKIHLDAVKNEYAITEFLNYTRGILKHGSEDKKMHTYTVEKCREVLISLLNDED